MQFIKYSPLRLLLILPIFFMSACINIAPVTSGIGSEQLSAEQKYSKHLQVHNKKLANQLYINFNGLIKTGLLLKQVKVHGSQWNYTVCKPKQWQV